MGFSTHKVVKVKVPGLPLSGNRHHVYVANIGKMRLDREQRTRDRNEFFESVMQIMGLKIFQKYNVPLKLELEFIFEYPATWNDRKRRLTYYKTSTPSLKGLVYFVIRSFSKKIWLHDRLLSETKAIKHYGEEDCTIITITPLNDEDMRPRRSITDY